MEDTDLKEFATKIGIWVFIVVVFGGLMTLILINKFGVKEIDINKEIDKKNDLLVLVVNEKTKKINNYKEVLNNSGMNYKMVYSDRERYFDDFLRKVDLESTDIIEPTIIYIEKGKVSAILGDLKKTDELETFLEYNTQIEEG